MNLDAFGPLPISWDDEPVEWEPWHPALPLFICDRSRRTPVVDVCARCGRPSQGQMLEWAGRRARGHHVSWGKRQGIRDLIAFRCVGCGLDTVLDYRTDESWELGPEDYGCAGSVAPRA